MKSSEAKASAVQDYVDAGFALFACGAGVTLKAPQAKHWQQTPYDILLTASDLPSIYGVVLDSSVVVLDYDPKRDDNTQPGYTQLDLMWKEYGDAAKIDTFIVKTGGGGLHVYFSKPPDLEINNGQFPGYPAIDIKTHGGYVIGAGSTHISGSCYEVLRGDAKQLSPLPDRINAVLSANANRDKSKTVAELEQDDMATRQQFAAYLLASPASGTYAKACYGKNLGLPQQAILEVMREHYNPRRAEPKTDAELATKIDHAFRYSQDAQGSRHPDTAFKNIEIEQNQELSDQLAHSYNRSLNWSTIVNKATGATQLTPTINNVLCYFRRMPTSAVPNPLYKLLRYNQFSAKVEFTRPAPWHNEPTKWLTNNDLIMIKDWLCVPHYAEMVPLWVSTDLIREACVVVSQENSYHPVRDYLNSLKWDGTPRLDMWLTTYCKTADTRINREFAKNTLIAAVARIMKPGCKHDEVLILESKQGTRKSTVCEALGGEWYGAPKLSLDRVADAAALMRGYWIVEMPDMELFKRSDIAAMRAFLSIGHDIVRLPYQAITESIARQSIFIGTMNPTANGYLLDTTGNRRYWPVAVGDIDVEAIAKDRDQLFAEATARYNSGEAWWITDPVMKVLAEGAQKERTFTDSWEDLIDEWLSTTEETELTVTAIAWGALNIQPQRVGKVESNRIAEIMRAAGYKSRIKRTEGKSKRVWEHDII